MTDPDRAVDRVFEAVAEVAPHIRERLVERRDDPVETDHPTGDKVIAADAMAEELLFDRLANLDGVGELASEDSDRPVDVGDGVAVSLDPLDGSSNVASNNLCGTIVGVSDGGLPAAGDTLVGAAYVVYGPITSMVVAVDDQVTELAVVGGEVLTLERGVTLPNDPTVYGVGGAPTTWPTDFAAFADELSRELKLRYGGAMVGDVNQVLTYGGLFAYPAL
ncbi:MAG: class 1 fructose-bisphosphatase, partial [Halobacteriales archaeon]